MTASPTDKSGQLKASSGPAPSEPPKHRPGNGDASRSGSRGFICFFDSGLGGLNTLRDAVARMPEADFIYYGDTANMPYGPKSERQVRDYMVEALEFLEPYQPRALVIACNTATCAAGAFLRAKYSLPIIGMEPAIKPAVEMMGGSGRRVLLLATALTINSAKVADLKAKVDPLGLVDALPCPELVEMAEALNFDQDAAAACLRRKLASFDLSCYGAAVLGCTHYSYFHQAVAQVLPAGVEIIDGNDGTVRRLMDVIGYETGGGRPGKREIILHLTAGGEDQKIAAAKSMLAEAARLPVKVV